MSLARSSLAKEVLRLSSALGFALLFLAAYLTIDCARLCALAAALLSVAADRHRLQQQGAEFSWPQREARDAPPAASLSSHSACRRSQRSLAARCSAHTAASASSPSLHP